MLLLANRSNEKGSSLLLAPAAILILVILAAITVDSGLHFLAQRQLQNAAAGLANDLSTRAIDWNGFYNSDGTTIDFDLGKAQTLANDRAAQMKSPRLSDLQFSVSVIGQSVVVEGQADSPSFFSLAVPGAQRNLHIDIRESADLVRH